MLEDLKTLALLAVFPFLIWAASAYDRAFVRWPDWMDAWMIGLATALAVVCSTIVFLKPVGMPLQNIARAAVHPAIRMMALLNLAILWAFIIMMFTGMALVRM